MKPATAKICADCPARQGDEWRARGAILRMQLRRHDLTFRELQIADLILDKTCGWHRTDIVFPQLRYFTDLTGIGQPDVVKVLKSLHARRVIRIQTIKGRPTYSINHDFESWKALPRISTATMQATLNLMREQNGLEPMHVDQEATLNFKNSPLAKIFEAEVGNLPIGEPTSEFPNLF